MKFDYTLQSAKKNIAFDLDKESYTSEEVAKLLKSVCGAIEYAVITSLPDDIKACGEPVKIKARQFEYNGIF